MSKVTMVVKMPAAPGKGAELAEALQTALDAVESEEGTRYYILHAEAENPDTLWMYELYDSEDALHAHMTAPWFQEMAAKIGPLFGGAPEFHALRPIGGKGL